FSRDWSSDVCSSDLARKDREFHVGNGAGEGNRTLVSSLGSYSSTIELRPRRREILSQPFPAVSEAVADGHEDARVVAALVAEGRVHADVRVQPQHLRACPQHQGAVALVEGMPELGRA